MSSLSAAVMLPQGMATSVSDRDACDAEAATNRG
jgi:hypothetical protein